MSDLAAISKRPPIPDFGEYSLAVGAAQCRRVGNLAESRRTEPATSGDFDLKQQAVGTGNGFASIVRDDFDDFPPKVFRGPDEIRDDELKCGKRHLIGVRIQRMLDQRGSSAGFDRR